MSHTKTFDCEGCRPYCYGGYHMREDADGDGDYVLAEDFNRVKKQRDELLANDFRLRQSIRLRNPYVDPISLLQVDLLCRWREGGREDEALLEALVTTVNGIAAGIQNTG